MEHVQEQEARAGDAGARGSRREGPDGLERGLAWLALGLGLAQVAAPGRVARLAGVPETGRTRLVLRALGAREIATGVGILSDTAPAAFMWARVGGDALDLSLLGLALAQEDTDRRRAAVWTAAVAGVAAADTLGALRASGSNAAGAGAGNGQGGRRTVRESVTINRPRDEVYGFWRDLERLPEFMVHLEEVRSTGEGRTHWRAKGPAGSAVEWDAETTAAVAGERIAWRTLPGAQVESEGSVRFADAPGGRGTEVHVVLDWSAPGGAAGAFAARMLGEEPGQQIRDDLRRLKQILETGGIVRSDGSPEGTQALRQALQRPAQPAAEPVLETAR